MAVLTPVTFQAPLHSVRAFQTYCKLKGIDFERTLNEGFARIFTEQLASDVKAVGEEPGGLRRSDSVKPLMGSGITRSPRSEHRALVEAPKAKPKTSKKRKTSKAVKGPKAAPKKASAKAKPKAKAKK